MSDLHLRMHSKARKTYCEYKMFCERLIQWASQELYKKKKNEWMDRSGMVYWDCTEQES